MPAGIGIQAHIQPDTQKHAHIAKEAHADFPGRGGAYVQVQGDVTGIDADEPADEGWIPESLHHAGNLLSIGRLGSGMGAKTFPERGGQA